jgi:Prolipoprotein diacylglyceryl transferase
VVLSRLPGGRLPWDQPLASIPSPGSRAWRFGPLPVRAYALCVIAGIVVGLVVASHRYRRSGGGSGVILDVAAWAVPFGLIGAATALSGERTFMLCAACYAVGSFWVESVRIGPLPQVLGVRYGAIGDVAVFLVAVAGLYLTRPRPIPPARSPGKRASKALAGDSPGDVMFM